MKEEGQEREAEDSVNEERMYMKVTERGGREGRGRADKREGRKWVNRVKKKGEIHTERPTS